MFFLSDITVTPRDLAHGISAHDKNGNLIYGNDALKSKTTNNSFYSLKDNRTVFCSTKKILSNDDFKVFKTKLSTFGSFTLSDIIGSRCSLITEFYGYNLQSITKSAFFSGCTNLKKIFLPVCSSVASGCFEFGSKKKDIYLFSLYNNLWSGFEKRDATGATYAGYTSTIYVPSSYYSGWYNVNPLRNYLSSFTGVY